MMYLLFKSTESYTGVSNDVITNGNATVENGAYNETTLGNDLDGDGDALDSGTWSTQWKTILN